MKASAADLLAASRDCEAAGLEKLKLLLGLYCWDPNRAVGCTVDSGGSGGSIWQRGRVGDRPKGRTRNRKAKIDGKDRLTGFIVKAGSNSVLRSPN